MIGSLGLPELLFILVLALLIFGPRKLPEVGRTLGRALGELRRATSDLKRSIDVEVSSEAVRPSTKSASSQAQAEVEKSLPRTTDDGIDEASEPR